jgi:hypothetical protein
MILSIQSKRTPLESYKAIKPLDSLTWEGVSAKLFDVAAVHRPMERPY